MHGLVHKMQFTFVWNSPKIYFFIFTTLDNDAINRQKGTHYAQPILPGGKFVPFNLSVFQGKPAFTGDANLI